MDSLLSSFEGDGTKLDSTPPPVEAIRDGGGATDGVLNIGEDARDSVGPILGTGEDWPLLLAGSGVVVVVAAAAAGSALRGNETSLVGMLGNTDRGRWAASEGDCITGDSVFSGDEICLAGMAGSTPPRDGGRDGGRWAAFDGCWATDGSDLIGDEI